MHQCGLKRVFFFQFLMFHNIHAQYVFSDVQGIRELFTIETILPYHSLQFIDATTFLGLEKTSKCHIDLKKKWFLSFLLGEFSH